MPRQIEVISVDGGAKTSKSTVSEAITEALRLEGKNVKAADAGRFIRQITSASLQDLGATDPDQDISTELDAAIARVIAADSAFDPTRQWDDLESRVVNRWVSEVGKRQSVQQQKMLWYKKIVEQAQAEGVEVLVINARNPISHLAVLAQAGSLHVCLSLFTDCDPREAAIRKLRSHGVTEPSGKEIEKERAAIIARRQLDLTRPTDTFIRPADADMLQYTLADSAAETIRRANAAAIAGAPQTILFDTSTMTKQAMEAAASGLATTALELAA
jgi:cytidylate kinase